MSEFFEQESLEGGLLERAFRTSNRWLALGHEESADGLFHCVRSESFPDVYDANFAHSVRGRSPAELDELLVRFEERFRGLSHRCVRIDPATPPEFEARLYLEGFELAESLVQMLLEGELWMNASHAGSGQTRIRRVASDEDWKSLESLLRWDHLERADNEFRDPWGLEVTRAIVATKRVKAPEVQYFLASVRGVDCAFFSAWPGENGIGKVEDLFTRREYRGRGIATELIGHCVADARRRGAGPVLIGARAGDTPIHMYAQLGFRPIALERIYLRHIGR